MKYFASILLICCTVYLCFKIFKMAAFEEHMCEKGGFLFVIFNHVNVCAEEWEFFYGSVAFLGTAQLYFLRQ